MRILVIALALSILGNIQLYTRYKSYFSRTTDPVEKFHSGAELSTVKIALLKAEGTIMGATTKRLLRAIEQARTDDAVKAAVLQVDSPGGLVADSHQIYHELKKLSKVKPVAVAMTRLAASGGYYIAMGAGPEARIFAEPTCWTGSIGVILPHFDLSTLAEKIGVSSEALKTGEFKDTLNPLRKMTDREKDVWTAILDESFQRFLNIIDEGRNTLDYEGVKKLATGQVYTAEQAVKNGLVDEVGYVEDAVNYLQNKLGINARVITYDATPTIFEILSQSTAARDPESQWKSLLSASVPQALYLCSWLPALSTY